MRTVVALLALAPTLSAPAGCQSRAAPPPITQRDFEQALAIHARLHAAHFAPDFREVGLRDVCSQLSTIAGVPVRCTELSTTVDPALETPEHGRARVVLCVCGERSVRQFIDMLSASQEDLSWRVDDAGVQFFTRAERSGIEASQQFRAAAATADRLREHARIAWLTAKPVPGLDGPAIELSGRVEWTDEHGSVSPLAIFQTVRIGTVRVPERVVDWTKDTSTTQTLWTSVVTDANGSFRAPIYSRELECAIGRASNFQVGLELPDLDPDETWSTTHHVLPQSVTRLAIPGPEALASDLQLINACSGPSASACEPIAFVRAVNRLRSLGKTRAIELLQEYVSRTPQLAPWIEVRPRPEDISTGDSACVLLIVRLLFEPDGAPVTREPPGYPLWIGTEEQGQAGHPLIFSRMMAGWPQPGAGYLDGYPFRIVGDLPLLLPSWLDGRTGSDSDPLRHLKWAEQQGVLRREPFRPADDPVEAAESLWKLHDFPPKNDPRAQVWRALEGVVGLPAPTAHDIVKFEDGREVDFGPIIELSDSDWQRFVTAARAAHLKWDDVAQRYVAQREQR